MRCPKYIKQMLIQRAACATKFTELDIAIKKWLEKNDLLYLVEDYDICGGCESYVNPFESSNRILEIIENSNKGREI